MQLKSGLASLCFVLGSWQINQKCLTGPRLLLDFVNG